MITYNMEAILLAYARIMRQEVRASDLLAQLIFDEHCGCHFFSGFMLITDFNTLNGSQVSLSVEL